MSVSLDRLSNDTPALLRRVSLTRALFYVTALYGCVLLWIAPRLPLCDLPQHAAQIALLHDLLIHASPWESIVRINYFTPYLTGYGIGVLLSFLMSVNTALKLTMTVAYLTQLYLFLELRKRFTDDDRLDWLFVPGFFGFAFIWGFYTFLVAAPIGMAFVLVAHRFAVQPSWRVAAQVLVVGLVLFFSHGLTFMFSCAIGAGFLVAEWISKRRTISTLLLTLIPYFLFGALCVVYSRVTQANDPLLTQHDFLQGVAWFPAERSRFLLYVWGMRKQDFIFLPGTAVMLAAPFLLRRRLNWTNLCALVPLIVVLVDWVAVPSYAMKIAFLYERFALYLMPAVAIAFSSQGAVNRNRSDAPPRIFGVSRDTLVSALLMLSCWWFMGVQTVREHRFSAESAPFETILGLMEPGQRAALLILDMKSQAYHFMTYTHYAAWYQAEKHGFVDYNFAWFSPQPARFRLDALPAIGPGFDVAPEKFDWMKHQGRIYRYFVVRDTTNQGRTLLSNSECDIRLVRSIGEWSLFERGACH